MWNADEDQLLREHYTGAVAPDLAVQLSRSEIAVRQRAAKLGLTRVGDPRVPYVKQEATRRFAIEHGWPEDLSPRQVQILDLLYGRGPATRHQLCAALGMHWPSFMSSNYLGELQRRGLVVSLGKLAKRPGAGRGSSRVLFAIPPHVTRRLPWAG